MRAARATLANAAWVAACQPEARRFRRALGRVAETQAALLRQYLRANRDTDFGRRHNFAALAGTHAYQQAVPLSIYDDYGAELEAIGHGRAGVLTAEPVRMFELSSGSTAACKLIPYTARLRAEFQRGLAPWIYHLYTRDPQLARGPAYWAITPLTGGPRQTPGGVPIGFEADSAYLGPLGQWLLRASLAVPDEVKQIADMAAFRYVTLLFLLAQPELRLLSIWHPSFLSLLLAPLPEWWDSLLGDLAAGTLTPPTPLEPGLAQALRRRLRPDGRRARALAAVRPSDPSAIWPALRLISCWADGPAAGHAADLQRTHFPGARWQGKGLLATEAFVSLPLAGVEGGVLAVTSHFFEFLPASGGIGGEAGLPRLAHQLEKGQQYSVVVTTGGGFYRYALQDVVEVTGDLGQAPCLRFVGKTDLVSDWFGEKLNERFVGEVCAALAARHQLAPRFRMLAPEAEAGGLRYRLYLELDEAAGGNGPAGPLAADLEALLRQNFHYDYCRRLGQLAPAEAWLTPPGTAERYLQACQARGLRLGSVKPALLQKTTGWGPALAAAGDEGRSGL